MRFKCSFCFIAIGVITVDVQDEVAVDLRPFISSSESTNSLGMAVLMSQSQSKSLLDCI